MMEPADTLHDRQARTAFDRWCHEHRLLGRDRLWPEYGAGWWAGTDRTDRSPMRPAGDPRPQPQNRSGSIVRVRLSDWRAATRLDDLEFWSVMGELEQAGQIIREHGYARPA